MSDLSNGNGRLRTLMLLFIIGLLAILFGGTLLHLENTVSSHALEYKERAVRIDQLEKEVQKLKTFHEH